MLRRIGLDHLDGEQMFNLIYSLIIEEAGPLDPQKARSDLDAQLETIALQSPTTSVAETWGTGADAEAGLQAFMGLGG